MPIDQHHAQVFICASKVASASSNKSLALSSTHVKRDVHESTLAKKKVRDALVTLYVLKEVSKSISKTYDFNRGGEGQVQGNRVLDVVFTLVL
ncbi:hypothetical protein Fmac_023153 [Flemingia macrophylla]|uniref:Uncharacterized protein n=1 Tax=Flemingia macrophylla TaxID=520843 RepID=A0ABD1LMC1_9FABA